MKEVKFNGKDTVKIISSIGEIRYDAMVMFNQYIIAIFQGIDTPLFSMTMDKIKDHYNKGEYMQAYNELTNFDTAVKFKEFKLDPMGICFAILLNGNDVNEDSLQERLKDLIDKGLKWDVVKEEVLNFMKLAPEKFNPYLTAWQIMGQETGIGL